MPIQSARQKKDSVNYRLHEQCSSCISFYGGECEQVEGRVSADAVCSLWKLKEGVGTKEMGKFFVEQYKEDQPEKKEGE